MKSLIYLIVAVITATIGMHMHGSVFWAVLDFFFWPWCWLKWLICQEVNITIIKESFGFFFQ